MSDTDYRKNGRRAATRSPIAKVLLLAKIADGHEVRKQRLIEHRSLLAWHRFKGDEMKRRERDGKRCQSEKSDPIRASSEPAFDFDLIWTLAVGR